MARRETVVSYFASTRGELRGLLLFFEWDQAKAPAVEKFV